MLCKSNMELSKYGKLITEENIECKEMFIAVSKFYFHPFCLDNVWAIEHIHEYCDQVQSHEQVFDLIETLYDKSEMMVLWYGNEYMDLDTSKTKAELINHVKTSLMNFNSEVYLLAIREHIDKTGGRFCVLL